MRARRVVVIALAPVLILAVRCKQEEPEERDPGNTETGEQLDPDEVVDLEIRPSYVQIDKFSELDLKAFARTRDGGFYDVTGGTWHSTNDDRATIDESGHLVPKAIGPALIEFQWEGIAAEAATVDVVADGRMEVTVVDGIDGTPVPEALVGIAYGHEFLVTGETDSNGFVVLDGDFEGVVSVSAMATEGYRYTSLAGVVPRQVIVPLARATVSYGLGDIAGNIRFDEDDLTAGNVAVAMAIPSLQHSPIAISAGDLLGRNREVSGFGLAWNIPENVEIVGSEEALTEGWEGRMLPGRHTVFAAGGVYDLSIALELALNLESYGTGALFPTMTQHIERLRFGVSEPQDFEFDCDVEGIEIPLDTELPVETWLDMAPPPPGHYWPDPILVLSWRQYQDAGYVGIGFGTGNHPYMPEGDPPEDDDTGDDDDATWTAIGGQLEERVWMPVREVARDGVFEDLPSRHLAFVWESGVDMGGKATGVISTYTTDERVVLPDFLDLPEIFDVVPESWHVEWDAPEGTDMTRMWTRPNCSEGDADAWEVIGPAMAGFRYPKGFPAMEIEPLEECNPDDGVLGTGLNLQALSLELASYQSLVNAHDESIVEFWEYVNRRSYADGFAPEADFP